MSNYSFSVMPSVSISRSRFERKNTHKTSFNLGQIVPIYVDEVLPGDTRSIDMAALVRMSTPIAPVMDNIYMDFFAFFVPNRIVWDHWKEFMGENNTSAGIPAVSYSIPMMHTTSSNGALPNTLPDYFGIPVGISNLADKISALPFRGYFKIYNRWFRNQNLIAPIAVNTTDSVGAVVGVFGLQSNMNLLNASKLPDYFTTALPYAQKGAAVSIPLGTTAPIVTASSMHSMGTDGLKLSTNGAATTGSYDLNIYDDKVVRNITTNDWSSGVGIQYSNLVADLSGATAATINQLRYAFQLQKLLEKDALYGSRYWEILSAHFGIHSPDATLQDPEYLGGKRMNINIDQVLSSAGYAPDATTTVGAPGANSVSGFKGSIFTKSFTEHGHLFILAVARHDQTYGQGLERMWSRKSRFDYYFPVFANLGAQEIKKKEIYAQGSSVDEELFGYQEAWAEYRYKKSYATGLLNPNTTGSMPFWTLATRFGSLPTLGQTFIEQDRTALSDALVSASTGPDFICDFMFRDIAVRPMPIYSIPGLIDHH